MKIMILRSLVNCEWSEWESWTDCSRSCGVGNRIARRKIGQVALDGGFDCSGNDTLTESCNSNPCPGIRYRYRSFNEHLMHYDNSCNA